MIEKLKKMSSSDFKKKKKKTAVKALNESKKFLY